MRQIADGGLPMLIQPTPDTRGETNPAAAAFSLIPSSAVCLPVVSDSQKLIWVPSNQIDLQLGIAAELEKAFDRFPYLTENQTAALAQRCSLHPDQVKVWFMLQRLRYGISWDYKDIQEVQRKVRPSQRKKETQNRMGEGIEEDRRKKKPKRELNESDRKKARKLMEEKRAYEGMMTREKVKQEQSVEDMKVNEVEGNKRSSQKKRKRIAVTAKIRKKRTKGVDEVVERAGDTEIRSERDLREQQKTIQSEATVSSFQSFVVSSELQDESPLLLPHSQAQAFNVPPPSDTLSELLRQADILPPTPDLLAMTSVSSGFEEKPDVGAVLKEEPQLDLNHNFVTDIGKLKELIETDHAVGSATFTPQLDSQAANPCTLPSQIRSSVKTQSQLAMMKLAFSRCQYPDREHYSRLATVIGVPRHVLVQWFGDMRYYVKKGKPGWMTGDQHSQALANIKYRQCLSVLAKVESMEGTGNAARKTALERSESCGEDESLTASPDVWKD